MASMAASDVSVTMATAVSELVRETMAIDLTAEAATENIARCQEALRQLGGGDCLAAVMLRTAQVVASAQLAGSETGLADEIQCMAERLDDDLARAYALMAWAYARPEPEHVDERRRIAADVLETAARRGEPALVTPGWALLLVALLEKGDIRSLDIELLDIELREGRSPDPDGLHETPADWYRCLRSILDGDVELAEQQAEQQYANARRRGTDGFALYLTRMSMIRWMQGRTDGAEEALLAARRAYPRQVLWPAVLALLWRVQGRRTLSEALLRSLPPAEELPHDRYWLSTVTVLADIAQISGDREDARRMRALLLPYADHLVPVGVGVAFWGTCARTLGLLEEKLGLLEDAREHLELAVELTARIGALAWHAEAQIDLAEFGLRHELTDVPAYDLLAEARATSEARGFDALARRALYRPRVRVLGRFEVISLTGTRAEWTSRKARELLKMLVAARGVAVSREVFMDALWPGEPPSALGNRFAVAVNVVRRALDPERVLPMQHHVVTEGEAVRLDTANLDIDLERFLTLAQREDEPSRNGAARLYRGDAFSDEPYADWALSIREEARELWERLG